VTTVSQPQPGTLPPEVEGWIGGVRYTETADFPVERGYIWTSCASVENGNPLFWDDAVAAEVTGGPIAPPSTLSLWFRPHHWQPGASQARLPLQTHFDLKDRLALPEAVMTDSQVVFHDPVRPGDVIGTTEILRSVSEPKTTKLGTGRFWVIDVEYRNQHGALVGVETFTGFGYRRAEAPPASAPNRMAATPTVPAPAGEALPTLSYPVTATTVVLGALATRDWRPMHHDVDFAVNRNGTRDIFLNTPNQQAWLERYVTDWTGPRGRLGRMRFQMRDSIFPGDLMTFTGTAGEVEVDDTGCAWTTVTIAVHAGERLCTTSTVRVARPTGPDDNPPPDPTLPPCAASTYRSIESNPWRRRGDQWRP
jgi:acyl dehydratase